MAHPNQVPSGLEAPSRFDAEHERNQKPLQILSDALPHQTVGDDTYTVLESPPHRKSTGGYPTTTGLTPCEVTTVLAAYEAMVEAGCQPNYFISINHQMEQVGNINTQRRRWLGQKISTIGTALKRQGYQFYAVGVFENPPGTNLHAHWLCYIPLKAKKIVERLSDGLTVKITRFCPHHLSYIVKQRDWTDAATEGEIRARFRTQYGIPRPRYRESGQPLKGKRLHLTKAVKSLLLAKAELPAERKHRAQRFSLGPQLLPQILRCSAFSYGSITPIVRFNRWNSKGGQF